MLSKSTSLSAFKQNQVPKKQGAFYELHLGKNNGPFLSKDIMYNNRNSMGLLTNKQILKSHQTMVNTMKNLDKTQKQSTLSPQKVQNFNGVIDYCMKQLEQFGIVSNGMKLEEKELHLQFEELNKRTSAGITQLYESSMPGLKLFLKKVKESNNTDKSQNYQLKRELEKMSQQASLLKKGLIECENKIESLERIFQNQHDKVKQQENNWV